MNNHLLDLPENNVTQFSFAISYFALHSERRKHIDKLKINLPLIQSLRKMNT